MMSKTAAEPLVRISKREGATFVQKVLVRAIAILLALVVDAFFIFFVTGLNPISVYGVMWNGTFMNTTRFSWALRDLSTLLCIAIALAPAFKMRFWNIGGEGQVLIGGLVAALIMVYFGSSLPAPLLFAAMVIGSVLAGAIWAFVPAWFKSRWNTNETLFTLMMNYVATSIVACMTNIMRGQASSLGTLNKATKAGWLPVINGQRYTINIIVVLVLTFAMYAYLKYSKQGYEISVVGESENTARYAGINVSRVMIRTMLLSGAICGLCGFLVVAGKDQTISTTSAGGNGFTAIIVAWLAKFNTFYMMLISFLLLYASIRITCINIRNGAKMELNNLSGTIYADTYRSQRETNFEEYLNTLYSSNDYTDMLEATVAGGLDSKIPLSTEDYKVSDISLEFNVEDGRVEYIFYCDVEFYVRMFGHSYPAITQRVELTGYHNTKF